MLENASDEYYSNRLVQVSSTLQRVILRYSFIQSTSGNAHSLPSWASFNMASDGQASDALPLAVFPTPLLAAYGSVHGLTAMGPLRMDDLTVDYEWFTAEEVDRMKGQQQQQQHQQQQHAAQGDGPRSDGAQLSWMGITAKLKSGSEKAMPSPHFVHKSVFQSPQAKEKVLKTLRSVFESPYANTSSPSGAHSSADLGAVSKAASKAAPPFNLPGELTTAVQAQYQRSTAKCFSTCFSEMLQTAAPATQALQPSTQPQPQHQPSQPHQPQMHLCKCGVDCVTALRAWDKVRGVHVEDEPQPQR